MRNLLAIAAVGALAVSGTPIVTAQDAAETQTSRNYDLTGFEGVSVVGPHHVIVTVGSGFSIRADGPQQTLDDTVVEIDDGRLEIHPRWDEDDWAEYRRDRWENYRAATFFVTLPRLSGAAVAGSGDMRVDRVDGEEFNGSVAGSGKLDVAAMQVSDARFSIAGSGDLAVRGSAGRSRVSIAGSGNLRAREVNTTEASISIAGSGNAELTVQDTANVSIVGGGDVDIAGPARCSVTRMGGGRVRCGGDQIVG